MSTFWRCFSASKVVQLPDGNENSMALFASKEKGVNQHIHTHTRARARTHTYTHSLSLIYSNTHTNTCTHIHSHTGTHTQRQRSCTISLLQDNIYYLNLLAREVISSAILIVFAQQTLSYTHKCTDSAAGPFLARKFYETYTSLLRESRCIDCFCGHFRVVGTRFRMRSGR